MKLWTSIGRGRQQCSLGEVHDIEYWGYKNVEFSGTYLYNNGYEVLKLNVYTDGLHHYYQRIEIDFYAEAYYVRNDDVVYYKRPRRVSGRLALDIYDRPLTDF